MPHQHSAEQDAADAAAAHAAVRTDGSAATLVTAAPGVTAPTGARAFSPSQAMALQRAAGNRATSALLGGGKPVQRIWPEDLDTDTDLANQSAPGAEKASTVTTAPPAGSPSSNGNGPTPTPTTAAPAPTADPEPAIIHPPVPMPARTPGEPPDPSLAKAPFDWREIKIGDLWKVGRPAAELSRVIPGVGLFTGMGLDGLQLWNDLQDVPPGEYPITTTLIGVRDMVALINNAAGHFGYIVQLLQDGLAGSVIGIELTPFTLEVNEFVSQAKLVADAALVMLDLGIMIGASHNKTHGASPDAAAKWQKIAEGSVANMLGDVFGGVVDLISAATAGAANTEVVGQGARTLKTVEAMAGRYGVIIAQWVSGMWNVYGSDILGSGDKPAESPASPTSAAPAQRLEAPGGGRAVFGGVLEAAAGILETESTAGRAAWSAFDAGIGEVEADAAQRMAEIDAICQELSGGKNLFQVIRDGAVQGVASMREEVVSLREVQEGATNAKENATQVRGYVDQGKAKIDSLQVPNVQIPKAEVGDGLLADAAESVLNAGAGVANAGIELALDTARSELASAKATALGPLDTLGRNADEVGEFLAEAAQITAEQTARVEAKIAEFEARLAATTGFEDAINLLIAGITEAAGGGQPVTIQDIRNTWATVPTLFDQVDALAVSLHKRAAGLQSTDGGGGGDAGPVVAPPIGGGGESGGGGSTDSW